MNEHKVRAVTGLDAPSRYSHFIKRAADVRSVWALWSDGGWAVTGLDDGTKILPIWPESIYAKLYAVGPWENYEVSEIDLNDLLAELIPQLQSKGILLGIFPTTEQGSITPSLDQLIHDLKTELQRIE